MAGAISDWGGGPVTPTVLLIAASEMAARDGAAAIEASAASLAATIDIAAAASNRDEHRAADVLLVEAAGADADTLGRALDALADHALRGAAVIVSFTEDQLDQVAATMLGHPVQLLCAADSADRVAALAIALAGRGGRVREEDPDSAAARLKRLSAEVARIADLLARIGREPAAPGALADRTAGFRAEADDAPITAAEIRRAIRVRRLRDQYFGPGLFEDPAWDMLLDLFAADAERAQVSVSSLCIAAAVAPTTALRWIAKLNDAGLFERLPDPDDRRRAFVMLTPAGLAGMRAFWHAMRRMGGIPV